MSTLGAKCASAQRPGGLGRARMLEAMFFLFSLVLEAETGSESHGFPLPFRPAAALASFGACQGGRFAVGLDCLSTGWGLE